MAEAWKKPDFFSRRIVLGATVGSAIVFFLVGILFWTGFTATMEATNKLEFCIGCHEMEENVYQEYRPTIHYSNRTGVRAGCPQCHVPDPWFAKMIRKIQASGEVMHKILGSVDTPEKFDAKRLTLAKRVWNTMKTTDSRECRNCHNFESMNPKYQRPRARKQHLNAFETGQTCIDCHKGIAHKAVRDLLTDEELEKLEAPNPKFIRKVPEMFLAGLKEIEEIEAKEAAEKQAAKAAEKARIDKAVAAALANYKAQAGATASPAGAAGGVPSATGAAGFGVDWSDVPAREVTIFYPGQTSMEWVLNGSDHGGARAFLKSGDTCASCHDKETAAMGEKIVTGNKEGVEPTLIPGKRGSIPVQVQAAHNGEYLYMRFQWAGTDHVPVPFVEGGKMDPDNPVKLALMLATDEVQYAAQAGCWGTCHHDLKTMPDAPDDQVTKYITESRSEIEIKGKGGKKRGGWDKRKGEAELKAELDAGHFMDILRVKSGSGETENGHVLADRVMSGGQGAEMQIRQEGGQWTVELRRKLSSDKAGDISLALDKTYSLGFAIHDDHANARYHHVSLGYKLGFDNADADINAVKRDVKAVAAAAAAPAAAKAAGGSGGSAKASIKVDWSKAPAREVTIFYPGQASMEWVLTGSDHGGARAFLKSGDSCASCHDKETEAMGEKIVTGNKDGVEPTLIPGKRGSIPVQVQATHDKDNLYLRFQWPDGEHAPAPFVDGGKMDPDNPVKLAVMLATDEVQYAGQAGCWGTCHHDLKTMPDAPDDKVTKYISESRSEIEIKGKGGKKRGGWDKRKGEAEIKSELDGGHFMDIMRVQGGSGKTEDGHVLADRVMEGGAGLIAATAKLEAGIWTVVMQRKLASDKPGDLGLALDKVYNLGFAIHDDFTSARYHHVSLGYKLGFDNADVEINATAQ